MGTNDITGDKLQSKLGNTQAYSDGYDAIFNSKAKTMKLYNLKRTDRFIIVGAEEDGEFLFDHLDGAYSVCYLGTSLIHIAAYTDVIRLDK
jgi:hypothetical protein